MFVNKSISRVFSVLFVFIFTLTQVNPAYAAAGDLDPTFGGNGYVTTPLVIQNYNDAGRSISIQASTETPNAKIVMVGWSYLVGVGNVFTTLRYNMDGTLDASFDGDGVVTTIVGGSSDQANSVAIQPDEKIVVAGTVFGSNTSYNYQFGLVRYNSDGSLDTSFSGDGKVVTNVIAGAYQQVTSVAIQPDGKIVVVGYSYATSNPIVVVRYNSDGSLDTSFDSDGIVTTSLGGYGHTASSVAIQSDGKIVVVGTVTWNSPSYYYQFLVLRYNDDGSLDTSFDADGIATTSVGTYSNGIAVAIQPDGKIVAAGYGMDNDFAVVRYNSDGSLDTSFSGDGMMATNVSGRDFARSVAIQSDGQIVVAGVTDSSYTGKYKFGVIRLNGSDGSLDTSFDGDGILATSVLGDNDEANSVMVQSDGRIVVGGVANNPTLGETDFALVRYNNDGTLDSAFDADGKVTTNVSRIQYSTEGYDVAVQSDGKIVMVGALQASNWQFMVTRFNTDGSFDTSFDTDGIVTTLTIPNAGYSHARAVKIQGDGKIVVAGFAGSQMVVVRYNSDGSLDTSFSTDGIVATKAGGDYAQAYALAIQSDGQIVVGGLIYGPPSYKYQFGVIRLNGNDGSLDTSFDADGIATTSVGGSYDIAYAVALESDGGIVLAGNARGSITNDRDHFGVVRYNADGSLDTSFDTDGIVITSPSGYYDQVKSLAIQDDGQILVAGYGYGPPNYNNNTSVVRYNGSDGSLDTSFDADGIATPNVVGNTVQANAMAIQDDGQIIVAGYAYGPATNYQNKIGVVRLNKSNGSLDTSFNDDGIAVAAVSGYSDTVNALAIQPDGKIVAGGRSYFPGTYASVFMVLRLEGGSSDSNSVPSADAGGPYNGDEGSAIAMSGATASDPDISDTVTYAWSVYSPLCSFDDANLLNPNLTCSDNGSFDITLEVSDGIETVSSDTSVNVNNVAPSASLSNNGPINEGGSATVSFSSAADPSSDDTIAGFHYAFDCNGGSLSAATYASSGTSDSTNCPFANEGSYSVSGKVMDKDDGSNEYTTTVTVTSNQTITITTNAPTSAVYGLGFTVAATASSGLPVSYSSSGVCTNIGADFTMTSGTGTCTVMYDQAGDTSYNPAPQIIEVVNAEKVTLTVTADDLSKVYGAADPTFTFAYSGFVGGDGESNIDTPPTCNVTGAHVNVDSYPITCSGAVDNNYTFNYVDGDLTITPKPITVTADPRGKMYGDADPLLLSYQVTSGSLVGGDSLIGFLVRLPGENVGAYSILQGTLTASSNYTLTFVGADFTISKAEQVIAVNTNAPTNAVIGDSFTVAATASSGLSVTYSSSGACTNVDADLTMTSSTGTCIVSYDQSGGLNHLPAPQVTENVTALSNIPDLLSPVNAEQLLNNQPTFDWTDVSGAISYTIQISNNVGFTGTPTSNTVTDSTYTQPTSLPNNVTRYWRVQANRAGGPGPWSEIRSFVTARPPSTPGLASPGNNSLTTDYTPLLNWNDSNVPSGTTFQKYELQIATENAFTSPISVDVAAPVTNSSYTPSTDLDSNTTYYWRVRAYNTLGQYSDWSNVRNFRTALLPPTLVTPVEAEQMLVNRPTFEWDDVPGADDYRIQISNNIGFTSTLTNATVTSSTYTRTTDLPFGVTLYWRVRSDGANGPGAWSEIRSLTTTNPPSVPTLASPGNNAKVSGPSPLFNWNDSTLPVGVDFDHYQIQVATSNAFTTIVHDNDLTGITNSQDNTAILLPATTYYWRVRSFNTLGHASAWSSVRSVRIKFAGPTLTLPSSGVTVDSLIPTFTWDAVSGATNYTIQVSKSSTFSPLVFSRTATSPAYTHTANLQAGTTYYWRVRVRGPNTYGPGDWSQVFTFTTP